MLLKHSIFHADPHPGNISVTDEGKLILYDYGMVGRINNKTRINLIRLYLALVEKNPSRVVSAMDDLKMLTPDYNRSVIEKGIELSIRSMHGDKPDEMEVENLMELANKTMSNFPFILPKNLALYLRMASIIEGIYKTHDVDFKFLISSLLMLFFDLSHSSSSSYSFGRSKYLSFFHGLSKLIL